MPSNVTMTGFAYQVDGLSPAACWLHVSRNPRPADATIPPLTPQIQQVEWATEQLIQNGISNKCQIALSCVGSDLPWFEFELPNGAQGLAAYWSGLLVKSVLIIGENVILNFHAGERGITARYYPIEAIPKSST